MFKFGQEINEIGPGKQNRNIVNERVFYKEISVKNYRYINSAQYSHLSLSNVLLLLPIAHKKSNSLLINTYSWPDY